MWKKDGTSSVYVQRTYLLGEGTGRELALKKSQNCLNLFWTTLSSIRGILIIAWRNFCREMLSVEMILKPGMFSKTPFPKAFIRPQSVQEDISGIRFIQSLLVGPLQHLVRGSPDCGMETSER